MDVGNTKCANWFIAPWFTAISDLIPAGRRGRRQNFVDSAIQCTRAVFVSSRVMPHVFAVVVVKFSSNISNIRSPVTLFRHDFSQPAVRSPGRLWEVWAGEGERSAWVSLTPQKVSTASIEHAQFMCSGTAHAWFPFVARVPVVHLYNPWCPASPSRTSP